VRLATEAAEAPSASAALRRVRALRRELDEFERAQVARALTEGASFAAVGRDLGLSRQAIHRRFRSLANPAPEEPSLALSSEVRLAFRFAREEAASLGDPFGGEHLLIGLMRAAPMPALQDAGVSLERIRTQVSGASSRTGLFDRPAPPPDLRALLADPAREAVRTGSREIEPRHVLAGLLRDETAAAARTLRAVGADPAAIREQAQRGVATAGGGRR
jgi:Clp amino terminal domain, pathogenicity island component